ncbi:MAG: hypothetical protein ACLFXM_09065 [Acidimicrobiia bacterium]
MSAALFEHPTEDRLARAVAAVALVGAGVIHFAFAPTHLDHGLDHGAFFLAAGWLQLALAAALAFRLRPERAWLGVTVLVNAAIIGTWGVSRTVGVPGSEPEGVGFPDVTATLLELLVIAAAVALLSGLVVDRELMARPVLGLGSAGALALVALVSVSVSPSFSTHNGDGHDHGAEGEAAAGGHDDHGESEDDWAEERYAALAGHLPEAQIDEFRDMAREDLAETLRERSELLQGLPEDEREERIATYTEWAVENTIELAEGIQSGEADDEEHMHSHGPQEWIPITDPADQLRLQNELATAGEVIDRLPTVADAEEAGYRQIAPYVPGMAVHYIGPGLDDTFDPAQPEMLLYNGTDPDSPLVGLSYVALAEEPPEGFTGPNDVWHNHPGLCMVGNFVVGIDGTPEDLCESVGGSINRSLADLWMMHLWQVPGWESQWGLFSGENPAINIVTSDMWNKR